MSDVTVTLDPQEVHALLRALVLDSGHWSVGREWDTTGLRLAERVWGLAAASEPAPGEFVRGRVEQEFDRIRAGAAKRQAARRKQLKAALAP